ncbi:SRPBCC family protein [Ktedonobacter racemifer]|uniref:Activator of Hsp90 ATPase 1 family protein n=1 Tax=Ktedonobacter racemifer DSM 44963 TaxID=485913 RepID=D6TYN1_KTERA|nr:SRPBCC family protein [Ktedonobacter racemifer]EFH85106.1 Activator of Hsp90 ATPase 1 family protein [Ktedonobacter racemifer DSM 44963]
MSTNETNISAEPGKTEIIIAREFDAPRELVFKAFTDPALYIQWYGPRRFTMTLDVFEPERGGRWRYFHTDQNGNAHAFHGVYHEVLAPELIIDTFEFEGAPEKGHVGLETIRFKALPGGRTRVMAQSVFQSVADRDNMLQGGAVEGVTETYKHLAELLKKMERL